MPKALEAQQIEVFGTFADLRAFAVPAVDWSRLEAGEPLEWPSSVPEAQDRLQFQPTVGSGAILRKTELRISFEGELGETSIEFQRNTGKIMRVSRFAGEVTLRALLRADIRNIFTHRGCPVEADYLTLLRELKAGITYYQSGYHET